VVPVRDDQESLTQSGRSRREAGAIPERYRTAALIVNGCAEPKSPKHDAASPKWQRVRHTLGHSNPE
jgi:hypothetical protein